MDQLGEVFGKLMDALVSLGLPMEQIEAFFGEVVAKIMEVLGPIIGGIGG